MRWIVRVLGLGLATLVVASLGAGCGAQVEVGPVPVAAGPANCATVCAAMASCPGNGPVCPQTCQAATSLSAEAGCPQSLQAHLDCLSAQGANACNARQGACHTQTMALGACITNFCAKQRMGSPNQALCLQAAVGF